MSDDTHEAERLARTLVADGKGILVADETPGTLTKRFAALGIRSTEQSRRAYRELLFTAPDAASFISGVIMQDETLRQTSANGTPLPELLARQGIVPGIKVDTGAKPLAGALRETITEGLDGLRDRLAEYRDIGARFAKWRAVIYIGDGLPSAGGVGANAHAGAVRRALPGSEPRPDRRAGSLDGRIALHRALRRGHQHGAARRVRRRPRPARVARVDAAQAHHDGLGRGELAPRVRARGRAGHAARPAPAVPAAVPGIVFLSGRQSGRLATAHLDAINRLPGPTPWKISFSYGRALLDSALEAWRGRDENVKTAQDALSHRTRCNGVASLGRYTGEMEESSASPAHRHDAHDD